LEFRVTAVNPLDHAEEIKQLFVADERPEFVPFFDRAYAAGVQAGGGSWVGRDPDGHIVMHLACFPRRFRFGERDVVGGLMRDALVARPYRSFFPAHALIKRATEDTRALGRMDFVYTNPNRHAKAVMDLCGFAQVGTLERYVLPVGHRRWIVDRPIGLVHAGVRWVRGGATLVPRAASEFSAVEFASPPATRRDSDRITTPPNILRVWRATPPQRTGGSRSRRTEPEPPGCSCGGQTRRAWPTCMRSAAIRGCPWPV